MSGEVPGTTYLIDTSVMARVRHPEIAALVEALIDDGVACTGLTLDLEAGYSARGEQDIKRIVDTRSQLFTFLPLTTWAEERARQVQVLLAERGLHRSAGVVDLMTAAVAEQHRATVLHYDRDFEIIASVTGQQHRWVAPPGSID